MGERLPGPRMCQLRQADVSSFPGDVSTLAGDVSTLAGDLSSFPGDVFTFPANVSRFPSDVFTLPANVFSFPSDVFSFRGHVFSFRRRAPWRFGRLRGEEVSRSVRKDWEAERGVRGCPGGLVAEPFGRLRADSQRTAGWPSSARTAAGGASLPPASDSFGGIKCADALGGRVHERVRGMVAGDTTGSDRGFEEFVPLADDLYSEHLEELRKEGLIECVDAIHSAN